MQKFNGAVTAGSINGALIGKTVTSLPNEALCINCAVTLGAFTSTSESPIKHKFIGCAITFTGDTANYSGQVELTFIDCVFTNSATATNIKGDGYSVVYITNCSGSIKVGTNDSTEIPIFYINGSPDLTIARFSSTYQYADIYIDGEIELYNKNYTQVYTSLDGSSYTWTQNDGTPSSVNANGIIPGYTMSGLRLTGLKRLAVHYFAVIGGLADENTYAEGFINVDLDGDLSTLGFKRGAAFPVYSTVENTPKMLQLWIQQQNSGISFLGAQVGSTGFSTVYIDKIRGILRG